MSRSISVVILCLALAPASALAQPARDRVSFGSDVHVGSGEVVRDAVSFGGDTIIEGDVLGDAVSFGGSVVLLGDGRVRGDVTSFGGEVREHGGVQGGERLPIDRVGEWIADAARSAVAHVLLFLIGLVLLGAARDRLGAMQVTIIKDGLKTAGTGLLAYVVAALAIALFALTIIGIPVAIVIALALPVVTYVGLAAAATIIGAFLPVRELRGREVLQLAAGVGVLFVASFVPVVGALVTIAAACLGFGALVRTRFAPAPPPDLPNDGGPYRAPAAT